MRKYLIFTIIVLLLSGALYIQYNRYQKLQTSYSYAVNNLKASENSNIVYKLTVDELRASNDSIVKKMLGYAEELKIKDKKIASLQYQHTITEKTDTLIFKDTIFRDNNFRLDTVLYQYMYTLDLSLIAPSTIITKPTFENEVIGIFSYKKETIKPRKKFFLWRLFQKKQVLTEATIINTSPYINTKEKKFIDVVDTGK